MNYCGLLGIVALLSYTVAVVFSPLDYPGYNWMAQAVSDLSASNAPSLGLWNQLSSLYNICTLICAMMVCAGIQGKGNLEYMSLEKQVTENMPPCFLWQTVTGAGSGSEFLFICKGITEKADSICIPCIFKRETWIVAC